MTWLSKLRTRLFGPSQMHAVKTARQNLQEALEALAQEFKR